MKSPAAYYLLLIYLFALCKPVMPLMQDIVAHTFFEHQHLTTVHKDGGSNHVSEEVGKLAHNDAPTNSNTLKLYDDVPLHLAVSLELNICNNYQILVHSSHSPDCFFPPCCISYTASPATGVAEIRIVVLCLLLIAKGDSYACISKNDSPVLHSISIRLPVRFSAFMFCK